MNFTATAEALQSQELCGNEVPKVPMFGQKDTVIKSLLVEVCRYTFSETLLSNIVYVMVTFNSPNMDVSTTQFFTLHKSD